MFNLNYKWIEINCPKCGFGFGVQLIDVKTERNVYCHNCKVTIHLQDSEASAHTGIEKIHSAINDFKDIFKNHGK